MGPDEQQRRMLYSICLSVVWMSKALPLFAATCEILLYRKAVYLIV